MSENERCSNTNSSAMDKIIGNVTAEMKNFDGQYVSLGYSTTTTPPPAPTSVSNNDTIHWNQSYNNDFGLNESQMFNLNQQFNYVQAHQPGSASQLYSHNNLYNNVNYEIYQGGNNPEQVVNNYGLFMKPHPNEQYIQPHVTNNTQLIENLVGNWVIPNNSGTYSPFGSTEQRYQTNNTSPILFDNETTDTINQFNFKPPNEVKNDNDKFNFNNHRDGNRKPRMVAEVKPMRPTYSDILTKPVVPQQQIGTKHSKNEIRDAKLKKDSSMNNTNNKKKSDKNSKTLNRLNTNNDLQFDRNQNLRSNIVNSAGDKRGKSVGQLDRKWASLDNIAEPVKNSSNNTTNGASNNGNNSNGGSKLKKKDDEHNLNCLKNKKVKNGSDNDTNSGVKNENFLINYYKNGVKKVGKFSTRSKTSENGLSGERNSGKRNQRFKRKDNSVILGFINQKFKVYLKGWWKIISSFIFWLFQVISDICSLSLHIGHDIAISTWHWSCTKWSSFTSVIIMFLTKIRIFTWMMNKFKKSEKNNEETSNTGPQFIHAGLKHNLTMPSTGEEAMKRLLACKGKDPYSILGVSPSCTDDDIRKYYKRQAVLVHPDKNQQPGAEEAFKILVHAFDMIGVPERRAAYDRGVAESAQVEQAWSELTELLAQLQKKVEAAANTIRCSACGLRHKRIKIDRPIYAARNCVSCKIHHAAREGDIWAEAQCLGFLWHYYACMEGGVYDITDWASCQKGSLKQIKSDSHHVQYRIALGKQNQAKRATSSRNNERPPDLENLLNSLYGQNDGKSRKNKKTK